MAVDDALKAIKLERCMKLVSEVQVVAAVGDEDAEFASIGVGAACLLRSYLTFRRCRTGHVMCDVCHCAPPSPALILAYTGVAGFGRCSARSLSLGARVFTQVASY